MSVKEAIQARRAYRSLESVEITQSLVQDLAEQSALAPSCYNKQPWRFVFAYDGQVLEQLFDAISTGNDWARQASLVVAVFSGKELDCVVKEREYYLFDTGMAVGFLMLRATELGLVAHPIAGFDEEKVKEILNIPVDMRLITLLIVGKKSAGISPLLNEKFVASEKQRPPRMEFEQFSFIDSYREPGK